MSTRLFFGGFIVFILLGLYVYAVWMAISVVYCVSQTGCTTYTAASFTDGMVSSLTLIGGLVSALVIAELAITPPGEQPLARTLAPDTGQRTANAVRALTWVYLGVWALTGLAAFVVGSMQYPEVLQPLTDLGQSWLGLAIAAGYAYFGISPRH